MNKYYLMEEILIIYVSSEVVSLHFCFAMCLPISSFCSYATVATTVGTAVAFLMVPMRGLGQDGWKIAAALMGRHIGGGNL